jgi:hypothetical protein
VTRPAFWKVWWARIVFGRATRTWPWNVPWQVVFIGRQRPPEHVFEAFRRLHGIDEGERQET